MKASSPGTGSSEPASTSASSRPEFRRDGADALVSDGCSTPWFVPGSRAQRTLRSPVASSETRIETPVPVTPASPSGCGGGREVRRRDSSRQSCRTPRSSAARTLLRPGRSFTLFGARGHQQTLRGLPMAGVHPEDSSFFETLHVDGIRNQAISLRAVTGAKARAICLFGGRTTSRFAGTLGRMGPGLFGGCLRASAQREVQAHSLLCRWADCTGCPFRR